MLARRLDPAHDCHDLDALCARHGVSVGERHRALPDARLLHEVWNAIGREHPPDAFRAAIEAQLAEPLLLPDIDAGTIDALPPRRGVFELLDADDQVLLVGRAGNLRQHFKRYFRLDRHSARAAEIAAQVKRIRWHPASGPLDARLKEMALRRDWRGGRGDQQPALAIRIDPTAMPAASIVDLVSFPSGEADLFGIYATGRKATNALLKIAKAEALCHRLLGIRGKHACACGPASRDAMCVSAACAAQRTRHLMRLTASLSPLRMQPWPYAGPIAIRERTTVHVFDHWEHLGSVRTTSDMLRLVQQRRNGFDAEIYALLRQVLPATKAAALRVLAQSERNGLALVREPEAPEHSP
jgi:DNA polymerase-3 subunit epsilon